MRTFSAKILKIGVNPHVLVPKDILRYVLEKAGKEKGPIPVRIVINNRGFDQTLVKYAGKWRLYLNTAMRKVANRQAGDVIDIRIEYDPRDRTIPMHPRLSAA